MQLKAASAQGRPWIRPCRRRRGGRRWGTLSRFFMRDRTAESLSAGAGGGNPGRNLKSTIRIMQRSVWVYSLFSVHVGRGTVLDVCFGRGTLYISDKRDRLVHPSIAHDTNNASNDPGWNAGHPDYPEPFLLGEIYDRKAGNQQGDSRSQVCKERPFVCQKSPIDGQFIPQDQTIILKFRI